MRSLARRVLVLVALLCGSPVASAIPVTFAFTGQVVPGGNPELVELGITPGLSIVGHWSYDTDTPAFASSDRFGTSSYRGLDFDMVVGDRFRFSLSNGVISVANANHVITPDDALYIEGSPMAVSGLAGFNDVFFNLDIADADATVFNDRALPLTLDSSEFEYAFLSVGGSIAGTPDLVAFLANIDSFGLVSVPEPSTLPLFALALGITPLLRRRA